MIYVSSDWHGWPLEKILQLLQQADFGPEDTLYILGDVIDRGREGTKLLQWIKDQPNIRFLLGNHEDMLLSCAYLFETAEESTMNTLTYRDIQILRNWKYNGGVPTIEGLEALMRQSPETVAEILDYLRKAPIYAQVEAGGKKYILVHGGLGNFAQEKPLELYTRNDLLWARPALDTAYYEDATVIFGHTPTAYYGREYAGKPVFTDTWINIDVGAAGGMPPLLLRLDDGKQFY